MFNWYQSLITIVFININTFFTFINSARNKAFGTQTLWTRCSIFLINDCYEELTRVTDCLILTICSLIPRLLNGPVIFISPIFGESLNMFLTTTSRSSSTMFEQLLSLHSALLFYVKNLWRLPVNFFHEKPSDFIFVTCFLSILKFGLPRLLFEVYRTKTVLF